MFLMFLMLHFITSEVCRALPLLTVLQGLCSDVKAASLEPQGQSHIYVSTHWPLHVAVMVGTLPYITYTLPVILPHESADWLRQQSLGVKPVHYIPNTAVYYVLCITLTLYTPRPDVIGSILSFCVSSPSRWDSKNLQGARDPVRTSESDHHGPSDRHLGVYRHRKPKAHCFLEQAR